MKICFLDNTNFQYSYLDKFNPKLRGAETILINLSENLVKLGHDVTVINNCSIEDVDPDEFVRWTYSEAMKHRNPIYKSMASWGITVQADLISQVKTPSEFNALIGSTISKNIK